MFMNRLPPQPFLLSLLRRTAGLWVAVHAAAVLILMVSGGAAESILVPTLATSLWVLVGVVGGTLVGITRRGERRILANLGCSMPELSLLVLSQAVVLEVALQSIARGLS
jgi:hypothetical protein